MIRATLGKPNTKNNNLETQGVKTPPNPKKSNPITAPRSRKLSRVLAYLHNIPIGNGRRILKDR